MAKPFSNDLRYRLVEAVRSGLSRRKTAELFQVSVSCVIMLMQKVDATGEIKPARFGGFKTSPLAGRATDIRGWVPERSDITIVELQSKLPKSGTRSSPAAIVRFLQQLGLTQKQDRDCRRAVS